MVRQSPGPMKIPTLQFLGAKDKRAAYRQGLLFDAITKKLGTKMKTYVYENSGHSFTDSVETSVDVVIKSMMFLEEIEEPQWSNFWIRRKFIFIYVISNWGYF